MIDIRVTYECHTSAPHEDIGMTYGWHKNEI